MQNSLRVQRVGESDIPVMYALLVLCGEHMHRTQGFSHWYPYRPYSVYVQQLDVNYVYAIYSADCLAGTFALSKLARSYYQAELWTQPEARALYFGLFGVLPVFQGKGVGRWAMQQVDLLVQKEGYTSLRFDAVSQNVDALRFYDALGYMRRGIFSVPTTGVTTVAYERVFEGQ